MKNCGGGVIMKYVEVFELMKKRDNRVLQDKELFRKSQIIDKMIDLTINEIIFAENKLLKHKRSPFEDDERYVELYEREKTLNQVAKALDLAEKITENKFKIQK